MKFTETEILEELTNIAGFLEEVDIAAQVVPKGPLLDQPSLLISLPSMENFPEDFRDVEIGHLHLASASLSDLSEGDIRVCRCLSIYSRVYAQRKEKDEFKILRLVNRMNQTVPVGHFFYGETEGEEEPMVQYRALLVGAEEKPFDVAAVAGAVMEMGIAYDLMKDALEEL